MDRELSTEEMRELLGAYALDAVDDDEREQIERFLQTDPRARGEVAAHREAAAYLARTGGEAPAGLWERIASSLDEPAPHLDLVPRPADVGAGASTTPGRVGRTRRARMIASIAAVAAVLVVALVFLGVTVLRQGDRVDQLSNQVRGSAIQRAEEAARRIPGTKQVTLRADSGATTANIVYTPDGTGYFSENNLPALPAGRTYQLWALVGSKTSFTAISAGVLGPDPGVSAFRFPGRVVGFAVTKERAPGVVSSANPPFLKGLLS